MTQRAPYSQSDANVAFVERWYQSLNSGELGTLKSMIADEHIDHAFYGPDPVKPEVVINLFKSIVGAFPDWQETVEEIVANDGDTVVLRATGRGTQQREHYGRQPTGQPIAVTLLHHLRIVDGKLKEHWSTNPFEVEDVITGNAAPERS